MNDLIEHYEEALEKAAAEIERLRAAVERMGIGVNHIATYRTDRWPDYGTACDAALEALGAGQEYDMWCCWNAAMCARDALANAHGTEREGGGNGMPGEVLINVHILLAIRDALVAGDSNEAYHQLRMAVDADCKNALRYQGDHWKQWEDIAAAVPPT